MPDALGGLGDLYVTVADAVGSDHTALWTFQHDGYGGGRWKYNSRELLRDVRAAIYAA